MLIWVVSGDCAVLGYAVLGYAVLGYAVLGYAVLGYAVLGGKCHRRSAWSGRIFTTLVAYR